MSADRHLERRRAPRREAFFATEMRPPGDETDPAVFRGDLMNVSLHGASVESFAGPAHADRAKALLPPWLVPGAFLQVTFPLDPKVVRTARVVRIERAAVGSRTSVALDFEEPLRARDLARLRHAAGIV